MSKMVQYNLRLPPEMLKEIERVCEGNFLGKTPVSEFIRKAIAAQLQEWKSRKMRAEREIQRDTQRQVSKENEQ